MTTIIVCITLLLIVAMVCYTSYKMQNNSTYEEVKSELRHYADQVQENNNQFENYWEQIVQLRAELQQLLRELKEK